MGDFSFALSGVLFLFSSVLIYRLADAALGASDDLVALESEALSVLNDKRAKLSLV